MENTNYVESAKRSEILSRKAAIAACLVQLAKERQENSYLKKILAVLVPMLFILLIF